MKNIVPRVAAVHDISGFGRCSLTVIMPILSCMGVQVCPIPTAVLSTHSGGFGDMVFDDLTNNMECYIEHWAKLDLSFDCIYTGFLGNEKQIDIVANFCERFRSGEKRQIVVDPVMGDYGKLYKTYTEGMQKKMKHLVEKAHIITPNLTETAFLLGRDYSTAPMNDSKIKSTLSALSEMGPEITIITGVTDDKERSVNVAYDREQDIYWKVPYVPIPASYPGTGDAFTSVMIGALMQGDSLPMAIERASDFVALAIKMTYGYRTDSREGIMLEKALHSLFNRETNVGYFILE